MHQGRTGKWNVEPGRNGDWGRGEGIFLVPKMWERSPKVGKQDGWVGKPCLAQAIS